ncbi:alpha-L-fucosidase [Actinomadura kijaniata]|uniref:alpha-L-fucosidase n=1 Tax=Actinomadura kijaniata TaxID=46161 RepID=UPI000A0469F8|nr:alpha-L-fucosidase [Actinomadura kijaniata]
MTPAPLPFAVSRRTVLQGTAATALAAGLAGASPRPAHAARPLPAWYDDAKFGVFVHWNPAAIPAYAPLTSVNELGFGAANQPEWKQRQLWRLLPYAEMYQNTLAVPGSETARFHAARYGSRPYDAFVEEFRTRSIRDWDPDAWAELFQRAGARYGVLTTKTEDGFLLWPSAHRNPRKARWQSTRDVPGELAAALRRRGVRFGTYYCGGMDWTFGGLPITDDASFINALPRTPEYLAYTDTHWRELVARYKPSVLWNDYGFIPGKDVPGLHRDYYRQVPDGVVNDRFDQSGEGGASRVPADFATVEYGEGTPPANGKWEACRGIGTSFGYNRLETDATYLTPAALIHHLAETVADGGNLLLNVGPTGTGRIPPEQEERLLAVGRWLKAHGHAVYGTRKWQRSRGVTTEGLKVCYTAASDAVHAIVLGVPHGRTVDLDLRLTRGVTAHQGTARDRLRWENTPHGTRVTLPARPRDKEAFTLRFAPPAAVKPVTG